MKMLIGAAVVTAALAFDGPAAIGATSPAAKAMDQTASSSGATDTSARRRSSRYYYRYADRSYVPYYYDRPQYYRPYPYLLPTPFIFGFGPWR